MSIIILFFEHALINEFFSLLSDIIYKQISFYLPKEKFLSIKKFFPTQCNFFFPRFFLCSLKGIRPELKLKTADGATLLESDTLSVILGMREDNLILSEVLEWKLPSLSNRYLYSCSELKCGKLEIL
jgi:hypothetical protein